MSGGQGGGVDFKAFNPFDNWHDRGWSKFLIGLPVGDNVGSPKWIKKHPNEAMLAAAIAATAVTAGAAAPAIGAAGAAGAGGAAAAGAGAGAAGAGAMTAAEYAAAMAAAEGAAAAGAGAGAAGAGAMTAAEYAAATGAASSGGLLGAATPTAAGFGEGVSSGLLQAFGGMGPEQASILAQQNAGMGLGADQFTLSAANTAGGGNATLGAQTSKTADAAYKGFQNYQKTQAALDSLAPKPAPVQQRPMQQQPQGLLSQADPMPTTPYSPMDPLWVEWLKRHQQGVM
jgi:hypothetical protein